MKIELDNAQGTPILCLRKGKRERLRVYFCRDGAIIQFFKNRKLKSVGTRVGRTKKDQAEFIDAEIRDGIILGDV